MQTQLKLSEKEQYLKQKYKHMLDRVRGYGTRSPHLYKGKGILPRDTFISWSLNNHYFHSLYNEYEAAGKPRELIPSVDRKDANKGYTLDNIKWITFEENYTKNRGGSKKMTKKEKVVLIVEPTPEFDVEFSKGFVKALTILLASDMIVQDKVSQVEDVVSIINIAIEVEEANA